MVDFLLQALESGVITLKKTEQLVVDITVCEGSEDNSGYVTSRIAPYIK